MVRRVRARHHAGMVSAQEAHEQARPGTYVLGWMLDARERDALLRRFAPAYARVVAHHVTLRPFVDRAAVLPHETEGLVVGRTDDRRGVEAMVVQIAGTTRRPDGGVYHVTWSLARGRRPVESNGAIAAHGWEPLDPPIPLRLAPAVFQ
jgi:hypothetical protein